MGTKEQQIKENKEVARWPGFLIERTIGNMDLQIVLTIRCIMAPKKEKKSREIYSYNGYKDFFEIKRFFFLSIYSVFPSVSLHIYFDSVAYKGQSLTTTAVHILSEDYDDRTFITAANRISVCQPVRSIQMPNASRILTSQTVNWSFSL